MNLLQLKRMQLTTSSTDSISKHEVVAGLDLSLRSAGVAIILPDGKHKTFSFGHSLTKDASEREQIERIVIQVGHVMRVLLEYKPKFVGMEDYAFSRGKGMSNNLTRQADFGGATKVQIYVGLKTVPIVLPSSMVRAFLLGSRKKKKGEDIKEVIEENLVWRGFTGMKNSDESDALAVALVVDYWANRRQECNDEQLKSLKWIDYQQSRPG
jgi:Holliday junction resolvasome RuvABC endonuclease subunit